MRMSPCGHPSRRLAFHEVDQVKICPQQWEWASSNPLQVQMERERRRKGKSSALSPRAGTSISPVLRHASSWFSGLGTPGLTLGLRPAPGPQAFGIRLNDTTGSPRSPACRWQIARLLGLCTAWANSSNKSLHIYVSISSYILLVLFLWRTLTNTDHFFT